MRGLDAAVVEHYSADFTHFLSMQLSRRQSRCVFSPPEVSEDHLGDQPQAARLQSLRAGL